VGELVKTLLCGHSIISNNRIISRPTKWPFFISIHLSMQIEDAPFIQACIDKFSDNFEERIMVELKSPLYFECLILSHCFEFEIPNKARYKNKNEIVEKVEEPVTVSAS
jgi:hypothetical protein